MGSSELLLLLLVVQVVLLLQVLMVLMSLQMMQVVLEKLVLPYPSTDITPQQGHQFATAACMLDRNRVLVGTDVMQDFLAILTRL